MKKNAFRGFGLVLGLGLLVGFNGCGSKDGDVFDQSGFDAYNPQQFAKSLETYHQKDLKENQVSESGQTIYIDFSDGMPQAYAVENNHNMINYLAQKFTGNNVQWFGLGQSKIYELDFPSTQLYNKVVDPKQFIDKCAPIEDALAKITSANDEAILITDFEEYTKDKTEQFENFAKKYFIDWLNKGNSIEFYIANYTETSKDKRQCDKHLYFVVFNTAQQNMKNKVDEAWNGRGLDYQTFTMTTDLFGEITTQYPSAMKGGNYFDINGNDIVFVTNEANYVNAHNKGYEYYPCQTTWKDMFTNATSMSEAGVQKPFTHVLRNLFVDCSGYDSYEIEGLSLKVTNVDEDYVFFSKTNELKNHTPKFVKDASENDVLAEDNDAIVFGCYEADGQVKPEWVYAPKAGKEMNEVFVIDDNLFNNTKKETPEKTEIGIKFHPNFNCSQMIYPHGLIRVDITAKFSPKIDAERLSSLFSWPSITTNGRRNESLQEAVRNTLQSEDVKSNVNTHVYTFYIITTLE